MRLYKQQAFYEQLRALIAALANGFHLRKIVCNLRRDASCSASLIATSRRAGRERSRGAGWGLFCASA